MALEGLEPATKRIPLLVAVKSIEAAATPVWGQAAAPTASGAQSGASIPDVSGVWLHPSIPGFEPLSSGPTSVVNKSRLRTGPQAGTGVRLTHHGLASVK